VTARRFEGKVALITGAARGQGRAEAVRLASEGADIIAIDFCQTYPTVTYAGSTRADLDETIRLVEEQDQRALPFEVDTRDLDAMAAAVRDGVAEFGHLDVVVANAGMTSAAKTWEITMESWEETLSANLTGAFVTAKVTVPVMIEQGTGGSIVFTSSEAGLKGLPFLAHYVAAKHGVVGLTKTLANEVAQYNIRVNSIHPWAVNTGLHVNELNPMLEEYATTLAPIYMQALPDTASEPEDIAAGVAWLASDEARHVTGIQLPLDLGVSNR
jgi:SDR family mycofactocin-dependent oxidoreductase